jgi:hypothetical protein
LTFVIQCLRKLLKLAVRASTFYLASADSVAGYVFLLLLFAIRKLFAGWRGSSQLLQDNRAPAA